MPSHWGPDVALCEISGSELLQTPMLAGSGRRLVEKSSSVLLSVYLIQGSIRFLDPLACKEKKIAKRCFSLEAH